MDWIELTADRDKWRSLVDVLVVSIWVHTKQRISRLAEQILASQEVLLHAVSYLCRQMDGCIYGQTDSLSHSSSISQLRSSALS